MQRQKIYKNSKLIRAGSEMKRLNMFRKLVFGLLILTMVLISGCTNSNEQAQKTNQSKIINLHAQQLILNDSEVEGVLGNAWQKVQSDEISVSSDNGTTVIDGNGNGVIYGTATVGEGIDVVYDEEPFHEIIWYDTSGGKGENYAKPVTIKNLVFSNIEEAEKYYTKDMAVYSQNSRYYHYKQNKIDIGDTGNIYTIEDLLTIKNNNVNIIIKLIFRKTNVISVIYFDTEKSNILNIETAIELAKRQDEKISRILEMIK